MNQRLFSKDFTLVVIGQIISLFGNATIRFALPLYLLNITGSSALYGTVTACAFIPAILLSPVGGIVADRVNKRNVMVILDFFTAAVMETFIQIPFQKKVSSGGILRIARTDFAESIHFIREEKPVIGKALLVVCGINLFLAAMIIVAMPYLITEVLDLESAQVNRLYGVAEGMLAAGGLAGGICAGIFPDRLAIQKSGNLSYHSC